MQYYIKEITKIDKRELDQFMTPFGSSGYKWTSNIFGAIFVYKKYSKKYPINTGNNPYIIIIDEYRA